METKIATALARGDAADAARNLSDELTTKLGTDAALVVVFASTQQPLAELLPQVASRFPSATVLGASTAGELTEAGDAKGGVAGFALAGDFRVTAGIGSGLRASAEKAVAEAAAALPGELAGFPHRTGLLLVDALAGHGEEVVLLAATALGIDRPLAGGGAGDDLAMKATQVGVGDRVADDAVVLAQIWSKEPLAIGVSHGHTPLSGPHTVTRATGNVVYELDDRPAWDVWLEETTSHAAKANVDPLADETAFLLRYEAALANGQSYKIRAPLARNKDGSLVFACEVPKGAVVRITEGSPAAQLESAREAARRARAKLEGKTIAGALVFDCICRKLVLGDGFAEAARAISHELGGAPIAGFETYGEIAFDAGDMSGFHNTTSVVLAFPR